MCQILLVFCKAVYCQQTANLPLHSHINIIIELWATKFTTISNNMNDIFVPISVVTWIIFKIGMGSLRRYWNCSAIYRIVTSNINLTNMVDSYLTTELWDIFINKAWIYSIWRNTFNINMNSILASLLSLGDLVGS